MNREENDFDDETVGEICQHSVTVNYILLIKNTFTARVKHLYDDTISPGGYVWAHKTCFTPPLLV